ncbi:membrane protein [Streptomyces sp. MMG1533]|uniref:RDD family protein n=1 Tax=Streptomyces sp. MMG1533 TaxID=1415546 RepID=UPI0006AFB7B3|nr:RDD family protein [Streptomyces sp. MMG1533]KOU70949.1 membrane protein [Streptomyces sp. MMG1533]
MSAPTPAPGDDRPRDGYYPDPSIPGYVRYWNGAAWVPGTSRPAPADGEPLAPPPGTRPASGPGPAPVEETGPHFFDEDPAEAPGGPGPSPAADAQHGSRPEPASAWGADRSRQSGFGGDQDRRVSWGSPQGAQAAPQGAQQGADPRVPHPAQPGDGPARPDGRSARTDGSATIPPAEPDQGDVASGNTFVFRRATAGSGQSAADGPGPGTTGRTNPAAPGVPGPGGPRDDDGTMTFRALSPRTAQQGGAAGAQRGSTGATAAGAEAAGLCPQPSADYGPQSAPAASPDPSGAPGFAAGKAAAARAAAAQGQAGAEGAAGAPAALSGPQQAPPAASGPQQPAAPGVPQQTGAPQPAASAGTPMTSGAGGGQPSWAQQVHRLAGASDEDQPVVPWKPPVEDIFQAAARRQASARPANLGKRLAARLVDTLVLGAVTAGAAVPLGTKAIDHVNEKIDAAKLSGETVTVWLLDGTTSVYLGIILGVLLLFGVLYEALPTAKWGRTLGKKLFGLEVRDIEGGEPPSFGGALRRWLVYSVPGLLGIGVVGVAWGLFDKPWHQCWHDKAAHTFVAG